MKSYFLITMWSGGKPAKKWQSDERPRLLEQGAGVEFVSRESRLTVRIIGSVSIEEYESGKEELEGDALYFQETPDYTEEEPENDENNIERLF